MKSKVYLETTIVSYLAALPSRDIVVAGHQQLTQEWWTGRSQFELFVSAAVIEEVARGDATIATRRTALLEGIPVLNLSADVHRVASRLLLDRAVPAKAIVDAVHIAVAAVNGIDYLLTWNCRHIANAAARGRIEQACRAEGLQAPVICTPEELMEA
jgi:predicted nucleic acid-binding protein